MRRHLPSLIALECFESVMKHGLVTKAAEELNLTQSAVSRQIGNLEDFTGKPLFARERKRLIPTPAAEEFLRTLSPTLETLERSVSRLISYGADANILKLGLLPTFGSRWLIPRLGGFTEKHTSVQLNIISGLTFEDFDSAQVDAAIIYGSGDWPDYISHKILDEHLMPVIAPAHYSADDIFSYSHLQMTTRPAAWGEWFAAQDMNSSHQKTGPKFENFTMMIEAVMSGLGVAIMPMLYVEADLKAGRLIAPFGEAVMSREGYHLAYPTAMAHSSKVHIFKDWLLGL